MLHFSFDRTQLFSTLSERHKLKNLLAQVEKVWTILSRILQPRVNNSLYSYYFKAFKTIIKKMRIIFVYKSKGTRTTLNKVFKYGLSNYKIILQDHFKVLV